MRRNITLFMGSTLLVSLVAGLAAAQQKVPRQVVAARPKQVQAPIPPVKFKLLATAVKPEVDMRPTINKHALQVKEQGSRPTCSIFALTFLHEYMFATKKNFGMGADFSEEYLNYVKNSVNGTSKDGGFFDEIDNGYQTWGCYMLDLVPYRSSFDPNVTVSKSYMVTAKKWPRLKAQFVKKWDPSRGLTDAELQQVLSYLKKDVPVAVGLLWPNTFELDTKAGVPLVKTPASKDGVFDGHSVALVGFRRAKSLPGGGYVIFRNSGGTTFGEEGYGYLSFAYLKAYANDALAYTF